MKWLNQHIAFRTLIIILMICISVPCSVKQDIKKALNIPTFENVEKPNKTTTCQVLTEKSNEKTSTSFQKKNIDKKHFFSFFSIQEIEKLPNINFEEQPFSCFVPIYILHEQYRI